MSAHRTLVPALALLAALATGVGPSLGEPEAVSPEELGVFPRGEHDPLSRPPAYPTRFRLRDRGMNITVEAPQEPSRTDPDDIRTQPARR